MTVSNESTARNAALAYASRGWAVFPCKARSKEPATSNGFYSGSTDPAKVEAMFASRDDFNVALATGDMSGVWVLDLDGTDGMQAFSEMEKQHGKVMTRSQFTGGGGCQMLFKMNGTPIRNRGKIDGKSIDVRGTGGYAVLPPSIHPDTGKTYQWIDDSTPVVEAPEWLVRFVTSGTSTEPSTSTAPSTPTLFIAGGGDLATDPGASKGNRHQRALELIGREIGSGTEAIKVVELALAWAARCSPPIESDEVLKIVSDFGAKRTAKVAVNEDIDSIPLPEPEPWPVIEKEAFYGLAGDFVRTIEPHSEADPAGLLIQTLAYAGNVVGRSPHFVVEGTRHYANLYAVLVGKTAKGRKGTSEGRIREPFRFVDEEWVLNRVLSGLVSGEGLIWSVRDEIVGPNKKGEIVVTDPGIDDKRLLVVEPEFASVLRAAKRETNTLSPTMRLAWDSGNLRTLAKNSPAKATDAHVSILGHITTEELRAALADVDCWNGTANRILWVAVRRARLLPDGGDADVNLAPHAARLKDALDFGKQVERMRRDEAAATLWREVYHDLAASTSTGLVAAVTSRAEAQVLRLSLIYSLLDRSETIAVEHLKAALAVWKYAEATARMIFGSSTGNALSDKLLAMIREKPGITRKELHRGCGNHVKAAALVSILTIIRDAKLAHPETRTTGGRPAECWFPGAAASERTKLTNSPDGDSSHSSHPDGSGTDGLSSHSSFARNASSESSDGWEEGEA